MESIWRQGEIAWETLNQGINPWSAGMVVMLGENKGFVVIRLNWVFLFYCCNLSAWHGV